MRIEKDMCQVFFTILLTALNGNAISSSNFSAHIRDYSNDEDKSNLTNVKTLQKEEIGAYSSFASPVNTVTFKEIPDNVLSGSSYSRGLLHHEHPGYVVNDYEDTPHYGYGYDYQINADHHDLHDYKQHHDPHDYKQHYDHHGSGHHHYSGHHSIDHGYHNKHYNHALATKAILWPVAGLALLGAAAALVSNPVLLQLGVVSGRKRRGTEEVSGPEITTEFKKYLEKAKHEDDVTDFDSDSNKNFKNRMLKWNAFKNVKHGVSKKVRLDVDKSKQKKTPSYSDSNDDRFIPIPLIIKNT